MSTSTSMTMVPILALLLLCTITPTPAHGALNVRHLSRRYTLEVGRQTACPSTLEYGVADATMTIPAGKTKANNAVCWGLGGKVLRSGSFLRRSGLKLPSLVTQPHVRFFAGVESATRVCGGQFAFNATATSYFIATTSEMGYNDADTGLAVEPGFVYLVYSHFAHLCSYRSELSKKEKTDILAPAPRTSEPGTTDAGPSDVEGAGGPLSQRRSTCFPADSLVTTPTGQVKMRDLKIGDRVLVGGGDCGTTGGTSDCYSTIHAFSHADSAATRDFIELITQSGATIQLTKGHLIYSNGQLVDAATVIVGDLLTLIQSQSAGISTSPVRSLRYIRAQGLYAPHTKHGDIVVNGIVASCYTAYIEASAAHALLAPFRTKLMARGAVLLSHILSTDRSPLLS